MEFLDVIRNDCALWMKKYNECKMMESILEVRTVSDCSYYFLSLNGGELWFGTLEEINAVVKSMLRRLETNDFFDLL